MKKVMSIRTTTYEDGDFLIDIVETDKAWEAWLYRKDYGVKDLMFGMLKKDYSEDRFLNFVIVNLEWHEEFYDKDHAE